MSTRLLLISHAATAAMRSGTFPAEDPLDARGVAEAEEAAVAWREKLSLNADAVAFASPAACARNTARALGLAPNIAQALAEMDHGRWRGLRLADVAVDEPDALVAWGRDPNAAAHGGELFSSVLTRVGVWLDALEGEVRESREETGVIFAVTHASIVRAAIMHTLNAPSGSFSHIEIPPLSVVELQHSARGWRWWPTRP